MKKVEKERSPRTSERISTPESRYRVSANTLYEHIQSKVTELGEPVMGSIRSGQVEAVYAKYFDQNLREASFSLDFGYPETMTYVIKDGKVRKEGVIEGGSHDWYSSLYFTSHPDLIEFEEDELWQDPQHVEQDELSLVLQLCLDPEGNSHVLLQLPHLRDF